MQGLGFMANGWLLFVQWVLFQVAGPWVQVGKMAKSSVKGGKAKGAFSSATEAATEIGRGWHDRGPFYFSNPEIGRG